MQPSVMISTATADQTLNLGKKIGNKCTTGTIVSIRGSLGSGKTVIAKGIALALGIEDPITSPTYTIIQEYSGKYPMIHMDLYRVDSVEEFELLGAEELLFGNSVTIIEWSEIIENLLPVNIIRIEITIEKNLTRTFSISGVNI